MKFEIAEAYLPDTMKSYYKSLKYIYLDPRKSVVRKEFLKHADDYDAGEYQK